MTPEQLRQRRRDRADRVLRSRRLIEIAEMQRLTDEANAIYEHKRLMHDVERLEIHQAIAMSIRPLIGYSWVLAEAGAKFKQASSRLKDHEYQMAYRGFKIPTSN